MALQTQPATFCLLSASLLICASRQKFVVRRVMYHEGIGTQQRVSSVLALHSLTASHSAGCCCCCHTRTSQKMRREARKWQGDSNLSLTSRTYMYIVSMGQTHLVRKKFRKGVAMSACPRPPRLRAFVRTNLSNKNKGQHG